MIFRKMIRSYQDYQTKKKLAKLEFYDHHLLEDDLNYQRWKSYLRKFKKISKKTVVFVGLGVAIAGIGFLLKSAIVAGVNNLENNELLQATQTEEEASQKYSTHCEPYFTEIEQAATFEVLQRKASLAMQCLDKNEIEIPSEAQINVENVNSLLGTKNLKVEQKTELIQENMKQLHSALIINKFINLPVENLLNLTMAIASFSLAVIILQSLMYY